MSATIYELLVNSKSVNQGHAGTPLYWKRFKAMVIVPVGYTWSPADFTGLQAKITADAIVTDKYARIQIIGTIQEATDASTAPTELSFGYGGKQQVYNGQYAVKFAFGDGDLARHQKRQAYNDRQSEYQVILFDEELTAIGTKDVDGSFRGFTPLELKANNVAWDMGAGVKQEMYVSFADAREFNGGSLMCIPTNVNVNNIKLVTDVTIQAISALTSRVVTLAFMVEGSNIGTNLAEKFAAILAANPTALIGTNHLTGAALTISSGVAGTINGQHGITYTIAATNYPTAGQSIDLILDTPAALAALGMLYYETPQYLNLVV